MSSKEIVEIAWRPNGQESAEIAWKTRVKPRKAKTRHAVAGSDTATAIGTEVQLRPVRIRVVNAYAALRYTSADRPADAVAPNLLLRRNDDAGGRYELFGGACPAGWTIQEALMKHLRDQLCLRFDLESLERFLIAALQKRNFARLVGGGTLYAPVVGAHGFQAHTAYVVIDVPNGNVLPVIARAGGTLRPFDGSFALASMTVAHRDLLDSLLRLRMQVFRPPYCLPDEA